MFAGHEVLILPIGGISRAQKTAFERRIVALGGTCVSVPTSKAAVLSALRTVTTVVSGSDDPSAVASALKLDAFGDIPRKIKVVTSDWLVNSLAASALADTNAFEVSEAKLVDASPAVTPPATLPAASATAVSAQVHPGPLYALITVPGKDTIAGACATVGAPFRGTAFYQVAKAESVSKAKLLVLYDSNTGRITRDDDVKAALKLPLAAEFKVNAASAPAGNILFVQTTSHNRQLAAGSRFIVPIEPGDVASLAGKANVQVIGAPVSAASTTPTPAVSLPAPAEPVKAIPRKRTAPTPAAAQTGVGGDASSGDDVTDVAPAPAKKGKAVVGATRATAKVQSTLPFGTATVPAKVAAGGGAVSVLPGSFGDVPTANVVHIPAEDVTDEKVVHSWTWHAAADNSVYWMSTPGVAPSSRIAAFDVDGTLTETNSGSTFAANASDWHWLFPSIPAKLKQLHDSGYKIVIMSNQKGVDSGKSKLSDVTGRFEQIAKGADVPMQMLFATDDSFYRKPCIGMWYLLATRLNGGVDIDMARSVYVGDAAGRPASGSRKKDFSAGDVKFARNLGVPFQTPEQFFLDSTERIHTDFSLWTLGVHPAQQFRPKPGTTVRLDGSDAPLAKSDGTEMVLLVGPPACGKSTITATHFPKYTRVNQDILKTKKKCLDVASSEVSAGKSVVIDATNKDPETRRDWVQLARELAVPIRAVYVDIPKELSMHMNVFRGCNPKSADPRKVPDMIIHGFYKNAVKPATSEGFSEVVMIRTIPNHFSSTFEEEMFFSWLLP